MMVEDGRSLQDFIPGAAASGGRAGAPLAPGTPPASKEAVVEAIREVYDPEISVNLYDLGLIYDLVVEDTGNVRIRMSLTSPMCPVAHILPQQVAEAAAAVEGVGEVEVDLVWDPPWNLNMMSEEARVALDLF
jgi:FeS assembly SUF system protein